MGSFYKPLFLPIKLNLSWTCTHSEIRTQPLDGNMHAWLSRFNPVFFFFFGQCQPEVNLVIEWLSHHGCSHRYLFHFTPQAWRLSWSTEAVFRLYIRRLVVATVSTVFTDGQPDQYNTIEFSNLWSLGTQPWHLQDDRHWWSLHQDLLTDSFEHPPSTLTTL